MADEHPTKMGQSERRDDDLDGPAGMQYQRLRDRYYGPVPPVVAVAYAQELRTGPGLRKWLREENHMGATSTINVDVTGMETVEKMCDALRVVEDVLATGVSDRSEQGRRTWLAYLIAKDIREPGNASRAAEITELRERFGV